jgi:hypothetical protein
MEFTEEELIGMTSGVPEQKEINAHLVERRAAVVNMLERFRSTNNIKVKVK